MCQICARIVTVVQYTNISPRVDAHNLIIFIEKVFCGFLKPLLKKRPLILIFKLNVSWWYRVVVRPEGECGLYVWRCGKGENRPFSGFLWTTFPKIVVITWHHKFNAWNTYFIALKFYNIWNLFSCTSTFDIMKLKCSEVYSNIICLKCIPLSTSLCWRGDSLWSQQ